MTNVLTSSLIGEKLTSLTTCSSKEVILVAPFIKVTVLNSIISSIPSKTLIHCVTRWKPDEIAIGISDIEVWPLLQSRGNAILQLHPYLHAKYYRFDNSCIVSSANLTQTALAWSTNFNIELGIQVEFNADLEEFERKLFDQSTVVDESIYITMSNSVEAVKRENIMFVTDSSSDTLLNSIRKYWFPKLRYPQDLYSIYLGNTENILDSSVSLGQSDLNNFSVPTGLSECAFNSFIASMLVQQPIVKKIDGFLDKPKRFGEMRDFVVRVLEGERELINSTSLWQTIMRWLLFFLPERYMIKTPNYSEIIYKIK